MVFIQKFSFSCSSCVAQDVWPQRWRKAGPLWDGEVNVTSVFLFIYFFVLKFHYLKFMPTRCWNQNWWASVCDHRLLPVQENFLLKFQVSLWNGDVFQLSWKDLHTYVKKVSFMTPWHVTFRTWLDVVQFEQPRSVWRLPWCPWEIFSTFTGCSCPRDAITISIHPSWTNFQTVRD